MGDARKTHDRYHHRFGTVGEKLARELLRSRGYRIADANVRYRDGEIDIIALSPLQEVVFVEVKTRSTSAYGAVEAVTPVKLRRMQRVAFRWLADKPWQQLRFDVIVIHYDQHTCTVDIDWYQGVDHGAS